jgi:hypothetical protein
MEENNSLVVIRTGGAVIKIVEIRLDSLRSHDKSSKGHGALTTRPLWHQVTFVFLSRDCNARESGYGARLRLSSCHVTTNVFIMRGAAVEIGQVWHYFSSNWRKL